MSAITSLPEKAQQIVKDLLNEYPDLEGAVLLVDYNDKLANADLPACFIEAPSNSLEHVQRAHSLCLHGASSIQATTLKDLSDLYRTTNQEKGETEDDS